MNASLLLYIDMFLNLTMLSFYPQILHSFFFFFQTITWVQKYGTNYLVT